MDIEEKHLHFQGACIWERILYLCTQYLIQRAKSKKEMCKWKHFNEKSHTIYFRSRKLAGTETCVTRIRAKVENTKQDNKCPFLFFDAYRKSLPGCVCYEVKLKFSSLKKKYFFICPCGVLVEAWGNSVPDQGLNLAREHEVLATGPSGKSLNFYYWIHVWFNESAQVLENGIKLEKTFKFCGRDRQSYLDCVWF